MLRRLGEDGDPPERWRPGPLRVCRRGARVPEYEDWQRRDDSCRSRYEARIITTELAQQTEQRKFIPVLRSGEFSSAAPIRLASRRGLDFTGTPYSSSGFQSLLRTLHSEEVQAPALGPKPVFAREVAPVRLSPGSGKAAKSALHRLALGDELNHAERELLG